MRIIIFILAIAALYWLIRWFLRQPPKIRLQFGLLSLGIVLVLLVATGRASWIFAVIGAILPFVQRILGLLRFLPVIGRLFQQYNAAKAQPGQTKHQTASSAGGAMSKEQALDLLGLSTGATRKEIIAAHQRLIQKVHPDRGGSTALAAQLNQARDVLLKK